MLVTLYRAGSYEVPLPTRASCRDTSCWHNILGVWLASRCQPAKFPLMYQLSLVSQRFDRVLSCTVQFLDVQRQSASCSALLDLMDAELHRS